MSGAHGHGHHGHGHAHANARAVGFAAILTGTFMVVEVIGGLLSGSLALLADAGHMATDFAALTLAWLAFHFARRPADASRTYGFDRLSVLAAFVNGLALFLVAGWIILEAARRLSDPQPVAGAIMLAVATAGLVVNLLAFWVLSRGDRDNLNLRAALLHVIGDLLGSVAAIAAALVILATGWTPIDPILSVLVALVILRAAWMVVRDSAHILLEGAPAGFDPAHVTADLIASVPGLRRVGHMHAWSISEERPMITLEAEPEPGTDPDAVRRAIKARLAASGFDHATVEIGSNDGAGHGRLPPAKGDHI